MDQLFHHLRIVNRRIGYHHTMNSAIRVSAHMGLHAKVPLVALASGFHFRIALLFLVPGRARCADDRRIDDRPFVDDQSVLA